MSDPRTSLVYDLPTRLFHVLFAGLFVTAFTIANTSDESPLFPFHMIAGGLLAALVLFRVVWGFTGTHYARFGSFELNPARLIDYFRAMFGGGGRKWVGHNPASSWAALVMIALAVGLAITGVLMINGRERYEDLHELLANAFLAVALLHVAGVVLHQLRHRDGFALSMLDGRKQAAEAEAIPHPRPATGVVMLAAMAGLAFYLMRGFDPATGALHAFGTTLQLQETESLAQAESGEAGEEGEEGDDD
jgi:cytochrome b